LAGNGQDNLGTDYDKGNQKSLVKFTGKVIYKL